MRRVSYPKKLHQLRRTSGRALITLAGVHPNGDSFEVQIPTSVEDLASLEKQAMQRWKKHVEESAAAKREEARDA